MTGPIMIGKDKDAAKGALVAYTGPDAVGVVPAGREGEVLVADPAAAAGVRWGKAIGGGIEQVSGTVTLDASGEPIREFFTTGATTFKANGVGTLISSFTAVVWRRDGSGQWGYQEVSTGWSVPSPGPDTTKPTAGTLTVKPGESGTLTLTVAGASDDRALHATPYRFSTNGGTAWSSWQASAEFTASGLVDGQAYTCVAEVRDTAGNSSRTSVVSGTPQAGPWLGATDTFTGMSDGAKLGGRTTETGGLVWAAGSGHMPSIAVISGTITGEKIVSDGGVIQSKAGARSVFSFDFTRAATGSSLNCRVALASDGAGNSIMVNLSRNGGIQVYSAVDGAGTQVGAFTSLGASSEEWSGRVAFTYDGTNLSMTANGQPNGTPISIPGLTGGWFGVQLSPGLFTVDNVEVKPL